MNDYPEALSKLYSLNALRPMKLGLENVNRLNKKLGLPSQAFPSVHVAGTNGKGSVVVKVSKGLQSRYPKVGLYISPHISTYRERISINGTLITEDEVVKGLRNIMNLADKEGIAATFFELTTLLAFKYFADKKVDFAVIETGLGGRLDATNILHPALTIITSIDFDHTDILGTTLEEISFEKSGIIKPNVPVILGPTAKIVPVLKTSPCQVIRKQFHTAESENRAIAEAALKFFNIPEPAIKKALTSKLPCRREKVLFQKKEVILDVAHNPAGLKSLFSELKIPDDKLHVIFALSKTKDHEKCLQIINESAKTLYLVEAPNGRCAPTSSLKAELLKQGVEPSRIHILGSIPKTIGEALHSTAGQGYQLLVTGSFFIMDEARKALNIIDPRDPIELSENVLELTKIPK